MKISIKPGRHLTNHAGDYPPGITTWRDQRALPDNEVAVALPYPAIRRDGLPAGEGCVFAYRVQSQKRHDDCHSVPG